MNDLAFISLGRKGDKGFVIVDADLFPFLNQWTWTKHHDGYAHRFDYITKKDVRLHKVVNLTPTGLVCDHINGRRNDCRRVNLRNVTSSQNAANRGRGKDVRSKYKGVSWHKRLNKWQVTIGPARTGRIHIGTFESETEAALAYNAAAKEKYGEFARLNVIQQD